MQTQCPSIRRRLLQFVMDKNRFWLSSPIMCTSRTLGVTPRFFTWILPLVADPLNPESKQEKTSLWYTELSLNLIGFRASIGRCNYNVPCSLQTRSASPGNRAWPGSISLGGRRSRPSPACLQKRLLAEFHREEPKVRALHSLKQK